MMKFLQEFWKSFKKQIRKEKKRKDKQKSIVSKQDFTLTSEPTQLGIEAKAIPPIRRKVEKIHINVGLDFGTSFTKVVYSQGGKRFKRALSFDHNLPIYPNYCLPSVAAIGSNGDFLLGAKAARYLMDKEWDSGFRRFKVVVAGKYDSAFFDKATEENFLRYRQKVGYHHSFTPEKLTAIFLAYAIRECRERISNLPEYKDLDVDMEFNICVPIEHIENNVVRNAFEGIFKKAEAIERAMQDKSQKFNPITEEPPQEYYPSTKDSRVFAIPEAVASIASYLTSLRREDGLHAIIDLGAGTTDVSICNLVSPRGDSESLWYAAKNIPLGTINTEKHIANYLNASKEKNRTCSCCEVYEILNELRGAFPINKSYEKRRILLHRSIREEFSHIRKSDYYRNAWGGAYNHLRKQTKWEKVEVFLTGGGSLLPFAEDAFCIPWWELIHSRYPISKLPEPDDYDPGFAEAPFERMTVAYGLSIPKPMLERYTLPKDAPDQTPPKLHYILPDRDEIYAK